MNTTYTFKTNKKLHDEAKKVASSLGVPLTTAMNAMLRQFVRDRRLVLDEWECPYPSHTPNAETRKALDELRDPKKRARLRSYVSAEAMFADVLGKNWREK